MWSSGMSKTPVFSWLSLRLSLIHQWQSQFELTDVVPGVPATLRIGAQQGPRHDGDSGDQER